MQNQSNSESSAKNLLTIGEASDYLGVSIDTLRRWEVRGRIIPLRSPGGHRYYTREDLDRLFNKKYVRDEFSKKKVEESFNQEAKIEPDIVELPSIQNVEIPKIEEEKPIIPPTMEEIIPPSSEEIQKQEESVQESISQNTQEPPSTSILEPTVSESITPAPPPQVVLVDDTQKQRLQDIMGE